MKFKIGNKVNTKHSITTFNALRSFAMYVEGGSEGIIVDIRESGTIFQYIVKFEGIEYPLMFYNKEIIKLEDTVVSLITL